MEILSNSHSFESKQASDRSQKVAHPSLFHGISVIPESGEVMIHRCSWLASPTLLPNEEGYFRGVSYLSLFHIQVTQTQDRRRDG